MVMQTALGAVDVVLCGTAVASVALFTVAGSLCILGEHFDRLPTEDGWLLVLDHRTGVAAKRTAYIECWCPATCAEGGLSALIVLCDPRPEDAGKPDLPGPHTLAALVRLLR